MLKLEPTSKDQMEELGFVVVQGLLDVEEDLQSVITEYMFLLDDLAYRWLQEGKITSLYKNLSFEQRLMKIVGESKQPYYQYFDISLPQDTITENTPIHLGPAVFNLLINQRLLDVVEEFIGPEIYSNPVQHLRIKLPENLIPEDMRQPLTTKTQWHQDRGVVDEEADQSKILTVWIPFTEATEENGCLIVEPGSHMGDLVVHCNLAEYNGVIGIPDRYLGKNQLPVPMNPGDALFFFGKLKHASLPNRSNNVRWSFDLRYQPIGEPTGRPWFPGFVARSRQHSELELRDPDKWANLWLEARSTLAKGEIPKFNRWSQDDPRCA